jgi:hypothetical protein
MSFQRKLIVVALASVLPMMSAHAQSSADLKKEIEALKAQLQVLTQKVEAMSAQPDTTALGQQVNRIEQRLDLADDDTEKSGFKGVKINGVIEASYKYDTIGLSHEFSGSSGSGGDEFGMIQITKESQDGEGVDWTLRLLPGNTSSIVHEASISIPVTKESRIIGGVMPDFQGYEYVFANANPTLGNQLMSHNALYDLAGATSYTGIGMSHTFDNGTYAFKWLIANVDAASDDPAATFSDPNQVAFDPLLQVGTLHAATSLKKTLALAYRLDWYKSESTYFALSGLHGGANREFNIMALEAGYTKGDLQLSGQLTTGQMARAAANGDTANWTGVSGLIGYKVVPRLQLLARMDVINNRDNGGGTYYDNGGAYGYGLGPERSDSSGAYEVDPNTLLPTTGASLTRLTLGTNYQINANTQWKTEYRLDRSSGFNFLDSDGVSYRQDHTTFGTSLVLSF